jgi:CRISPR-associated endonuclease/helicase Cas3
LAIAHIRQKDGKIQTVDEHLDQVFQLSGKLGEKIGAKHLAGLAGLLHDLGKNSQEFKRYIEAAVANPESPPRKGSVDHSTAGGKLLYDRFCKNTANMFERLAVDKGYCQRHT